MMPEIDTPEPAISAAKAPAVVPNRLYSPKHITEPAPLTHTPATMAMKSDRYSIWVT